MKITLGILFLFVTVTIGFKTRRYVENYDIPPCVLMVIEKLYSAHRLILPNNLKKLRILLERQSDKPLSKKHLTKILIGAESELGQVLNEQEQLQLQLVIYASLNDILSLLDPESKVKILNEKTNREISLKRYLLNVVFIKRTLDLRAFIALLEKLPMVIGNKGPTAVASLRVYCNTCSEIIKDLLLHPRDTDEKHVPSCVGKVFKKLFEANQIPVPKVIMPNQPKLLELHLVDVAETFDRMILMKNQRITYKNEKPLHEFIKNVVLKNPTNVDLVDLLRLLMRMQHMAPNRLSKASKDLKIFADKCIQVVEGRIQKKMLKDREAKYFRSRNKLGQNADPRHKRPRKPKLFFQNTNQNRIQPLHEQIVDETTNENKKPLEILKDGADAYSEDVADNEAVPNDADPANPEIDVTPTAVPDAADFASPEIEKSSPDENGNIVSNPEIDETSTPDPAVGDSMREILSDPVEQEELTIYNMPTPTVDQTVAVWPLPAYDEKDDEKKVYGSLNHVGYGVQSPGKKLAYGYFRRSNNEPPLKHFQNSNKINHFNPLIVLLTNQWKNMNSVMGGRRQAPPPEPTTPDVLDCAVGDEDADEGDEDEEKNPGNPFTVWRNKYKQNWLWKHNMDGNHMNLSPYAPTFGDNNAGPSGSALFFGRKWWYFNQDDYKPFS